MPHYRWVGETPRVRNATGEVYTHGDRIDPTDHELRAFGDRIEAVEDDSDSQENEENES